MKTAVIILGHGSKRGGNDAALKLLAEELRRSGGEIIEYAFLQYAQPTADAAVDHCVRQGAKKIVIVPFFLQEGVHVRKDIPAFIEKVKKRHPTLDVRVTDYVGAHPLMAQIIKELVGNTKETREVV
jgi:sirohydrochlorin ferrochelatase